MCPWGPPSFNYQDQVVGVVLCDLLDKNEPKMEKDGIFPQKFHQLERFFDDLKSPCEIFDTVKFYSKLMNISWYNKNLT